MKPVSGFIRREWELLVCVTAAVLLALFLGHWALSDRQAAPTAGASRLTEPPSVFGPGAFAFLQDIPPAEAQVRDPFRPSVSEPPSARAPERPPRRAQAKPPAPEPRPQPPAPAALVSALPVEPVAATPAVPPGPRLVACDLRYVFSSVNRSGRPVALIELQDVARPGAAPVARNVSAGDAVFGLRVQSFNDDALVLVDAGGRRQSVPFGGTRRVAVDATSHP